MAERDDGARDTGTTELLVGDRGAEAAGALEIGEGRAGAAGEARPAARGDQPAQARPVLGLPAHAERAPECDHGLERLDRLARPPDALVERGQRQARGDVARIADRADLELAPRLERPARPQQRIDVDRRRCPRSAARQHDEHSAASPDHGAS
jgi:hypothetical protein